MLSSSLLPGSAREGTFSQRLRAELGLEESGSFLPSTPWRKLHERPDMEMAGSDHTNDVPLTGKARVRRLAAVVGYLPSSRAHGTNPALSRLATADF